MRAFSFLHFWRFFTLPMLGSVVWFLSPPESRAAGDEKPTIKTIIKAWEVRQRKVKSARAAWKETHFFSRGYTSALYKMVDPTGHRKLNPKNLVIAERDSKVEVGARLLFSPTKYKFSFSNVQWSPLKQEYISYPMDVVVDGPVQKGLQAPGVLDKSYPIGSVTKARATVNPSWPQLRPLALTLAPTLPSLQFIRLSEYRLTGNRPVVQNRPCLELRHTISGGGAYERLLVDPDRDYLVLRQEMRSPDRTYQELDIRLTQNPDGLWVPSGWTILTRLSGGERYVVSASVTSCQINERHTRNDFALEFPHGTYVSDELKKEMYIIRPDGRKREVKKGEYHKSYEELLDSDPPGKDQQLHWIVWALGGGAVVLFCTGVFSFWRRRQQRANSGSGPSSPA